MQDVGCRIRRARRINGWTQERLATSLGVTASAVGHWERPDGHSPSSENLIEIARHLSVRVEWLAVGRGEMLPSGAADPECSNISLSQDEQVLVSRYQGLPSPSRVLLLQFLEALAASPGAARRGGTVSMNDRKH